MYAIIKTSGKQFKVKAGAVLEVNRVAADIGETITLTDSVLMVQDGDNVQVGTPTVPGATVTLEVQEHYRGRKLVVFKMKRRKRYRLKKGHRQELSKVVVKEINLA